MKRQSLFVIMSIALSYITLVIGSTSNEASRMHRHMGKWFSVNINGDFSDGFFKGYPAEMLIEYVDLDFIDKSNCICTVKSTNADVAEEIVLLYEQKRNTILIRGGLGKTNQIDVIKYPDRNQIMNGTIARSIEMTWSRNKPVRSSVNNELMVSSNADLVSTTQDVEVNNETKVSQNRMGEEKSKDTNNTNLLTVCNTLQNNDQESGQLTDLLMDAAGMGNLNKVKTLINNGVNINGTNKYGMFPLQNASGDYGRSEVVKILIDKGADVNQNDQYGSTALMQGTTAGQIEIVKTLLEKGANVNATNKNGYTVLMMCLEKRITISEQLTNNNLSTRDRRRLAMRTNNREKIFQLLIDNGANINAKDDFDNTALIKAAVLGDVEKLKLLIVKGADLNARNRFGTTALMESAGCGHLDIVKILIDKGADIKIKDIDGRTALTFARDPACGSETATANKKAVVIFLKQYNTSIP